MDDLQLIVKMMFGSHLYGTATPSSDEDYKGVFLPSRSEILLNRIPKSYSESRKKGEGEKNNEDDIDIEIYSLHYFIKLACEGQTVALDMLHAPSNMILEKSEVWDDIVTNRQLFYTKNLKAFIGYARRQASKYGIKGSRLDAVQRVIDFLRGWKEEDRLSNPDLWNSLPLGEHCYLVEDNPNGIPQFQIVGKIFQATQKVGYILPILKRFLSEYGKRAQMARDNQGIDWKAMSHAIRAALQTKEILENNTIVFPLRDASYLRDVKMGKLDYLTDVTPRLEDLMNEVEALSVKSNLPQKVNRKYWDNFLIEALVKNVF